MSRRLWYVAAVAVTALALAALGALALLYVLGVLGGGEAVASPAPLAPPPVGTSGAKG